MRTYVRKTRRAGQLRIGAVAVGLVAALAVAGCGGDGDGDGGGKKDRGSPAGSSSSGGSGGSQDGGGSGGGGLEGSWLSTTGGKPLALVIHEKSASLVGEDVMCSGSAGGGTITLKCPQGDDDRTTGRVESVDGKTLKVAWEGAGTDEFLRTEGGKLPEGLPSGMPTDLPGGLPSGLPGDLSTDMPQS
ncbi:hypothetical protein JQK87_08310 [Streptomyces sp. G44]|uniref:hypothetical protein n=1 Tax=Streptomyces sp. G44 TaxID=2807632 RepID=UPI001961CBAE|nr:hypothetical protein [Streptomyces sp. G44]MBM7168416.1 hypothetical protein [Streptomyces sp. G44]